MKVLVNQQSGSVAAAEPLLARLQEAFLAAGLAKAEVQLCSPSTFAPALRGELRHRPRCVVVGGGDGTLHTAAGLLTGTDVALGILPLGTLNHFARDVGLPLNLAAAVGIIAQAHTRTVDVAEVNDRIFINNCSLGGYPQAVRRRELLRRLAGHSKWRAMFWATLATLQRMPRLNVRLRAPQWSVAVRATFVVVSNNAYDNSGLSPRRARLDEGRLWIYVSRAQRWRTLGRTAAAILRDGLRSADPLAQWSTEQLQLEVGTGPIAAALDGELVHLDPPLNFRLRPRALHVLTP